MSLHESEEVQVSGNHYLKMGIFEERVSNLHPIQGTGTTEEAAELLVRQPAQGPPSKSCCCLALAARGALRGYGAAQPTWGKTSTAALVAQYLSLGVLASMEKCSGSTAAVSKIQTLADYEKNQLHPRQTGAESWEVRSE